MAEPVSPRAISEEEKSLSADWQKRIEAALGQRKDQEKAWKDNRTLLRGIEPKNGKRMRTNLHFANLAAMRPQVYAKDPEFACTPTKAVPEERIEIVRKFAATAEAVISELLVKRGKLKKRVKRQVTSAYTCSIGWLKVCWQEDPQQDPIITNTLKDSQDDMQRLSALQEEVSEQEPGNELQKAQLQQGAQGLQAQDEVKVSRGMTCDFTLPDDVLVLDASIREISDYDRAEALANRIWMTREQYKKRFGRDAIKGRVYREGKGGEGGAGMQPATGLEDKAKDLLAVWEVWEQVSGRVFTVCEGEEGYCRDPYSPTWTGKRWYPFFLLAFNEIDGCMFPLSDVELTEEVVREYNKARDDWERDRKDCLPLNIARKGGTLTPEDVERLRNRNGVDFIMIDGPGGRPISDDIFVGSLGQLNPANYDTTPSRQDMEMLVGGGDAARGSVLKAKTATEAEILSQGLRGRSAERTDVIEDMLTEVGTFVLEMALRKMTLQEVQEIAGPDAMWPELSAEDVFKQVTLSVRGGSTGKPDRLQEQDRWTKLLPVIEKAMAQVGQLRAAGQDAEAEAVSELVRETMRRFDERIDIERFLPAPKEGEAQKPQIPPELIAQVQQQMQELTQRAETAEQALKDKTSDIAAAVDKAKADAWAKVEVAKITAPIEAWAKVEAARVTAEAQPVAPPASEMSPLAAALPMPPEPAPPIDPM